MREAGATYCCRANTDAALGRGNRSPEVAHTLHAQRVISKTRCIWEFCRYDTIYEEQRRHFKSIFNTLRKMGGAWGHAMPVWALLT